MLEGVTVGVRRLRLGTPRGFQPAHALVGMVISIMMATLLRLRVEMRRGDGSSVTGRFTTLPNCPTQRWALQLREPVRALVASELPLLCLYSYALWMALDRRWPWTVHNGNIEVPFQLCSSFNIFESNTVRASPTTLWGCGLSGSLLRFTTISGLCMQAWVRTGLGGCVGRAVGWRHVVGGCFSV